jgi:PhoH-like ATPase
MGLHGLKEVTPTKCLEALQQESQKATYSKEAIQLEYKKKVLDTNVLLDRPLDAVLASFYEPTHVIIPLVVLNELDKFKKGHEAINEHCRATTRFLDEIRQLGKINEGVKYGLHLIQIEVKEDDLDLEKNDHKIIKSAQDNNSTLVSQDINARVIADAIGIPSENFAPEDVNVNRLYTGVRHIDISADEVQEFYTNKELDPGNRRILHNQFVIMKDVLGGLHEGIYKSNIKRILPLKSRYNAWGVEPKKDKNGVLITEQKFLMHLLLDPDIEFVSAIGPSGCGKTFLSIAAALQQVINDGVYNKLIVMRPLIPVGQDIGFLPGDKLEKLKPWMASTFDALEYLLEDYAPKDGRWMTSDDKIMGLILQGKLEIEAMAYIRGRSIPEQLIIVDDAQNLTQDQAATIITRAGEGSKVIFLGDISSKQIDNHRLTPSSNGLAYVVDRFKGEDIVGHITLETVVRSRLAQLGVEKL